MRSSRGSTRVSTLSTLSVNAMWVLAILFSLRSFQCLTDGSARHLAGHVGLVLAIAAQILGGVADRHRLVRGLLVLCLVVCLAVEQQLHRGGGGGEIAGFAFKLAIGGTAAFGHRRDANLGE